MCHTYDPSGDTETLSRKSKPLREMGATPTIHLGILKQQSNGFWKINWHVCHTYDPSGDTETCTNIQHADKWSGATPTIHLGILKPA